MCAFLAFEMSNSCGIILRPLKECFIQNSDSMAIAHEDLVAACMKCTIKTEDTKLIQREDIKVKNKLKCLLHSKCIAQSFKISKITLGIKTNASHFIWAKALLLFPVLHIEFPPKIILEEKENKMQRVRKS